MTPVLLNVKDALWNVKRPGHSGWSLPNLVWTFHRRFGVCPACLTEVKGETSVQVLIHEFLTLAHANGTDCPVPHMLQITHSRCKEIWCRTRVLKPLQEEINKVSLLEMSYRNIGWNLFLVLVGDHTWVERAWAHRKWRKKFRSFLIKWMMLILKSVENNMKSYRPISFWVSVQR